MAHSEISIVNLALAKLGAEAIRSFDENNKRARLSDALYDSLKNQLLAQYDWAFARNRAHLRERLDVEVLPGEKAYKLPADCIIPRSIYPRGHKIPWEIRRGNLILTAPLDKVYIFYTSRDIGPTEYSEAFVNYLAHVLAIALCPSITNDEKLLTQLQEQLEAIELRAYELEANQENETRAPDSRPQDDTFVNPEGKDFTSPDTWHWLEENR